MRNHEGHDGRRIGRWDDGGVTVTFRHRETDQAVTVVSAGVDRPAALRAACGRFDPDEWRIGTISTPQTIYDDVTFARKLMQPARIGSGDRTGRLAGKIPARYTGGVAPPEPSIAGHAGCGAWL